MQRHAVAHDKLEVACVGLAGHSTDLQSSDAWDASVLGSVGCAYAVPALRPTQSSVLFSSGPCDALPAICRVVLLSQQSSSCRLER